MLVNSDRNRNCYSVGHCQAQERQSSGGHRNESCGQIAKLAVNIRLLPMMNVTRRCRSSEHKTEQHDENDLVRPHPPGPVISHSHLAVIISCR